MIYLTGDTHGYWDNRESFIKNLTKDDYLIILGDHGFNWLPTLIDEWDVNCTTLCVLGNHENYHFIESFKDSEILGAKCKKYKNIYYIKHGEIFTLENKKFFVFGGALSIDKAYRIPYISWWPEEQPNYTDYNNAIENLKKVNWNIDYFLAHDVNRDIASKMFGIKNIIDSTTSKMLGELEAQIKINGGKDYEYFFGHWHMYGQFGDHIKYTCLYDDIYNLNTNETLFFKE